MKKTLIALLLTLCMLTTMGAASRLLRRRLLHGHVRNGRDTDHGGNLPLHDGRQRRGRLPVRKAVRL